MKDNRKKTNLTFISEVRLNINLFNETGRCLVQRSLTNSISIVVELNNSNSVIAFVLELTSNMNPIYDLNVHF